MNTFTRLFIFAIFSIASIVCANAQPCTWSGASGYGPVTPPCGSFASGNVGSGTYTYFNIVNAQTILSVPAVHLLILN